MATTKTAAAAKPAVPQYAALFIEGLKEAGVSLATFVPESLLKGVYRELLGQEEIRTILASNEADMPGILVGAYLGGKRGIMVMENSGLREACEPIARFNLSHQVPLVMAMAFRGDFGERNWWGHAHGQTMEPILRALRVRYRFVSRLDQIKPSLKKAFVHAESGQCAVALIFNEECVEVELPYVQV